MGSKKKVSAPKYEEFQDNDYITRERANIGTYGDWLNENALDYFGANSSLNRDIYNTQAANAYNTMWNDALANYRKANNQLASANYNRFGGLGSTGARYNQELLNRQQNDLASRLASQEYQMAEGLYQQELANRFNAANQIYNMYNNAGQQATAVDQANWNIRNTNKAAQYAADIQNADSGFRWGNVLSGAISGAGTGASVGGPWGALIGGVAGAGMGALSNYTGDSASQSGSALSKNLVTGIGGTKWGSNLLKLNNKNNVLAIAGKTA